MISPRFDLQDIGEQRLADTVIAVDRRGVDERDPGVEGSVQHPAGIVDTTPPVAGEGPYAEADLGHFEVAPTETSVAHGDSFDQALPARQSTAVRLRASHPGPARGPRLGGAEPVSEDDRNRQHDARSDERDDRDGHRPAREPGDRRHHERHDRDEEQQVADTLSERHARAMRARRRRPDQVRAVPSVPSDAHELRLRDAGGGP